MLIPVTEVQVRATSTGRDGSTGPSTTPPIPLTGSSSNGLEREQAGTASANSNSHFIWELIHLRCTQMSGGTQRRTEKVYQLSNR